MGKAGIILIAITFLSLTVFGIFFILRIDNVQTLTDRISALQNPPPNQKINNTQNANNQNTNKQQTDTQNKTQPRFALFIVLDDAGLSLNEVLPLEDFQGTVSIAILPKLHASKNIADFLYKRNIPYIIHMPMEPIGDKDPGQYALYTETSTEELQKMIGINMSDFDNYIGFNNHMGSKAVADENLVETLMTMLDRKMIVLDSRTTHNTILQEQAKKAGMIALNRDVFIDNFDDELYIKSQIRQGMKIAKQQHAAILIGHATKTHTMNAIKAMYDEVKSQNGVFLGLQDYHGFMSAFE